MSILQASSNLWNLVCKLFFSKAKLYAGAGFSSLVAAGSWSSLDMRNTTAEANYENLSVSRKGRCVICVLELVNLGWVA